MATHSSTLAWRIPVDRGAWWATDHGVAKHRTRLSEGCPGGGALQAEAPAGYLCKLGLIVPMLLFLCSISCPH